MWLTRTILFRNVWKKKFFQPLFARLNNWSLFAMNYGGGGDVNNSGEKWFVQSLLSEYLKYATAPIVFDVGANIGDYSAFVKQCLPGARVFAFEPCRETFEKLADNLKAVNIEPVMIGFSEKVGSEVIYNYSFEGQPANVLASLEKRLPTQHGKIEITSEEKIILSTIDEYCELNKIQRIALLKLDIEGHELKALRGAKAMLESGSIDFIQFEFGPANLYSRTNFYDFWEMLEGEYYLYRLLPGNVQLISSYEEQLEVYLTTNYIAVRKNADFKGS